MPDEHESCNKYDRLSHTSALGELFITDESKKAQEEIQKSCVFRSDTPSLAGAGQACLHFRGNPLEGHGQCAWHRSCLRGREGHGGGAAQSGSKP